MKPGSYIEFIVRANGVCVSPVPVVGKEAHRLANHIDTAAKCCLPTTDQTNKPDCVPEHSPAMAVLTFPRNGCGPAGECCARRNVLVRSSSGKSSCELLTAHRATLCQPRHALVGTTQTLRLVDVPVVQTPTRKAKPRVPPLNLGRMSLSNVV